MSGSFGKMETCPLLCHHNACQTAGDAGIRGVLSYGEAVLLCFAIKAIRFVLRDVQIKYCPLKKIL